MGDKEGVWGLAIILLLLSPYPLFFTLFLYNLYVCN
jgi:hypothetical protein